MTNLKELAHKYYKEMSSDSKAKSAEAERNICKILNHVINNLETIENSAGWNVRNYPERIYEVQQYGYYDKLPEEIECNPDDECNFIFETSWFDLDYESYYEELKAKSINSIKNIIERVEQSLVKHREKLQKLSESKFSDLRGLVLDDEQFIDCEKCGLTRMSTRCLLMDNCPHNKQKTIIN